MRGKAAYGMMAGLAGAAAWLALAGSGAAQGQPLAGPGEVQVETITPEESSRPLSFQDWCEGIKNLGSQRCGERQPEDVKAFNHAKRDLRALSIGPNRTLGCDANANVNPARDWVGSRDCNQVGTPPPDLQPFSGPR